MPNGFASTEGSLLGLQSTIGLALTNSFDLHHKQDALELYRPDKQAHSNLLLETWLNEVLHTVTPATCTTSVKGLSAFGIDKATLLSAGLTEEAVNLLYRALYVYPIGFQDKAKKLVGPLEHKHVPLNNIWRAYLAIAETAMKVGFKSLFLESLAGQQAQAAEVALAQAAARDAVGERGELEHMLTWLTGAHAEEAAMHRTFKAEATGLKERLNIEKATKQDLVQQCSTAEQNVKGMEDEVRLVKRQLAVMAKARDVARQEKEDWKATCNREQSARLADFSKEVTREQRAMAKDITQSKDLVARLPLVVFGLAVGGASVTQWLGYRLSLQSRDQLASSQEKMMQRVGAGLVAIQASTSMWPPDPDGVSPLAAHAGALGSEGASKELLAKLDSMQAQATALHEAWSSEKGQRIQLTDCLVRKEVELADQVMLNDANQNTIRILEADKEQLQTELADVEALRITPLYKSIDDLTTAVAARDGSIAEHASKTIALQAQIALLEQRLESKRSKKQAYKTAFVGKVEIEKELRRKLLEVDEHSSHQARQLDLLHQHTLAMHTLAPGVLSLQHSLKQHCSARRMLREKVEAAQAGKVQAEKEQGRAAALAATYHHDLELLKHEARSAIGSQQKHQQEKAALQDSLTTKQEQIGQLQEDKASALKQIAELDKQLADGQGSAAQLAAERRAEQTQHAQQAAQLEAQLQALDSLRYDLEQAKANLTAKLESSSASNTSLEIQILEAKSKAEQAQIMMNNSSDSCSRQLSQLHKELRMTRHEGQLRQGQLDTALTNLQRKTEKKRHYKVALLEETAQLQAALVHKDVRIGELNHRIDKLKQSLLSLHAITSPPAAAVKDGDSTAAGNPLSAVMATNSVAQTKGLLEQLRLEEAALQQRLAEIDAMQQYQQATQESQEEAAKDAQDAQPEDASSSVQPSMQSNAQMTAQAELQVAARERGTVERQLRGVAERISLATSRLQVEDAASSLTALEQLYQREQAQAVQSLHDAKQRLARQVQVIQADRDSYKAESEQGHQALMQAAHTQQHLQEQISFLEEERQTLTESWKKAESARKFLQSEVAALKDQRGKLKEELQGVTDKMVFLRDKPVTPPDRLANY